MEFRVLGSLEVVGPQGPIAIGSARQRAILALLVLHAGETISRELLIDELWGEDPPPSAQHTLGVHVAGLRRAIGPARVETQPNGYRLRARDATVDLARFEALVSDATRAFATGDPQMAAEGFAAALAVWRGPALGDLAGQHAARAERARLDELRAMVIERWVDAELASGRHLEQIPELRRLVTDTPLREAFQARLMLALYRSGRQADALAVYQAAREVLDRELGVEPGPELEAAQRAVLTHDPALELVPVARPPVSSAGRRDNFAVGDRAQAPAEAGPLLMGLESLEPALDRQADRAARSSDAGLSGHPTRRTVTILAAEISGPRTGEDLDPESARRPSADLFERLRHVIERHGGTVQPLLGDAILAVFGVPIVHEDDALRAVRAASEMRDALAAWNELQAHEIGSAMVIRVGVDTAQVVVRRGAGSGGLVTGDAVNVASRLAQAAGPDEILLGSVTFGLAAWAVDAEAAGALHWPEHLQAPKAVRLLAVTPGVAGHARRFDSPLVGRGRELRQLQAVLEQAIDDGTCQLFSLIGPAGVGKSRLVHEFLQSIRPEAQVLRGRCLPYGERIAFWPVAEAMTQAAGLVDGDTAEVVRGKIAALAGRDKRATAIAERVAAMIGASEAPGTTEETFWAIRSVFESIAAVRPLVIVFDDVQWGEPSFLDLIEYLADTSRGSPILLLCIARPELIDGRPGWGAGHLNATSVLLKPLADTEVARLLANLLGGLGTSPAVERKIAEAAEGNPLFVEEFVAMLRDDGVLQRAGDEWISTTDLATITTPTSIMALLSARLDRLPDDERLVLERAAVIGKVFTTEAVAALVEPEAVPDLARRFGSLVRRELIRPDRSDTDSSGAYRFKHILIRDAAYAGLPKQGRVVLHEQLADWLARPAHGEPRHGDDLIGAHLEQAYRYRTELGPLDEHAQAVGRLAAGRLAGVGRQAHARGDARVAEDLFHRAAAMLPIHDPARLALLIDLTETLIDRGEFGAAFESNDEVMGRAGPLGLVDVRWLGVLQRFRLNFYTGRGQDPQARRDARAAIRFLGRVGNDLALGMAWRVIGELDNEAGHLAKGRNAYERAIEHARRAGDLRGEAVARLVIGGIDLGGPATVSAAMQTASSLLDWARATGQLATESVALAQLGRLKAMVGDADEGRRLVYSGIDLARDLGRRLLDADSSRWIGSLEWLAGDLVAAEVGFRRGYEELSRLGETRLTAYVGAQLARMLYLQGRLDEAYGYTVIAEAQQSSLDVETGIDWRSVRGLVLARRGEPANALALAEEAVRIAEGTDLLWARGRAREDLADVLILSGRGEHARPFLVEAIGLYEQKGVTVLAERARRRLAGAPLTGRVKGGRA